MSVLLEDEIHIERILESEGNQQKFDDKFNRVDMLAENSKGELVIIEVQNNRELDYFHRMLYGTSKAITEYMNQGDPYAKVKKVYSVNIVYFDLGQGDDYVYHGYTEFRGIHTKDVLRLSVQQQEQFVCHDAGELFPEYYVLRVDEFDKLAKTPLDEWILFLKTGEIAENVTASGLREARERLRVDKLSDAEQKEYERHMEALRYQRSVIQTGWIEGKAEGKAAGKGGRAMKAEILFPEVCNLYGDLQNIYYLKRCCPALEIIETDLHSKPRFLTEDVALVYMGSTTEQGLRLAADALRPYAADIAARADAGQLILLTGNAPDVFSAAIESDSADTIEGLGILPGRVRYTMMKRHNSFFLGTFDGMEIVGFKSLFGFHYDAAEAEGWFDTVRGVGRTPESKPEGFRRGGLYATALIGPLLILNPPLCKWLLRQMGAEDTLAFEDAAFASFNKRVAEFKEPGRGFQYS